MIETKEDVPRCFGKGWDDKAAACSGGLDPTHKDPETGSHVRERCFFFSACGARTQAAKMQQQIIPSQQLVRPPTPPLLPQYASQPAQQTALQAPNQAPNQAAQLQQLMNQIAQMQQTIQQQQMQLQATRQGYSTQMMPFQPVQSAGMMSVDYKMPGYLTVPEPKGGSVWNMLGRSVVRSAFKSVGHTLANFWDITPLGDDDK
jgi:hypothetical protein